MKPSSFEGYLKDMLEQLGDREISVSRELTKNMKKQ